MTTASRCIKALPSYRPQLTSAIRSIPLLRSRLTPGAYNLASPIKLSRPFSTSHRYTMADSSSKSALSEISFSANQPTDLPDRVSALLATWELTPSKKGLKRQFLFKTFNNAWKFMDTVAQECKVQRHHPEWSNLYNRVTVEWTTHKPEGLSIKDAEMAEFCESIASEIGLKE